MTQRHGRKYARVNFQYLVKVTFSDQTRENFPIRDISLAGLFLICNKRILPEEHCVIELTQEWSRAQYTFTITGKVVRSTDRGVAIEFIFMKPDTFMMLQTSLLYRSRDPLAFGEEFADACPVILDEIFDKQVSNTLFELITAGENMEYSQTSQTQNAKPRKQRKKLRYPVTHLLAITAKGTSRILDINHNGLSIGCLYPNYFPDKMRIDILSADGIFIKGLKVTKCWENSHDSLHQSHTYERTVGLEIIETDNDQTFELVELIKHIEVEGMQTAVNC